MKALEKIREISKMLAACGIETAEKEAELLVRQRLNADLVDLYKNNPELDDKQALDIDVMAGRRSKREPLQYILGHSYFLGLKLLVGNGVLIPRPETELMAEYAVKAVSSQRSAVSAKTPPIPPLVRGGEGGVRILDLCTGSGCLALALAKEFPEAHVYGTDISDTALRYAKKNARINGIENVSFINGYLFEPFTIKENENPPAFRCNASQQREPSPFSKGGLNSPLSRGVRGVSPSLAKRGEGRFFNQNKFDLIISNPPYIMTDEIQTLQPEIKDWEPRGALDGGPDGLKFYREIISEAGKFLKTNGILMLEIGAGCAHEVIHMMKDAGYTEIEVRKDYAGIERIIQAKWTN